MLFAFHHMGAIDQMATEKFGPIASIAHGFQDSFVRWLLYFAPYSRLPKFLMGCLAAALYRQLETRAPSRVEQALGRLVPYLAIVAIAGAAVMVNRPANPFPFLNFLHLNFGLALPVVALIFCTSRYGGAASRALSWSWVVLGGEVSYSIYMLHPLIVRAAGLDAIPIGSTRALTSVAIIRLIVALVATVGLSIVSYQIIEAPARRLLRRLLTIDIAPLKAAPAETLP
jgi:peptidoglycan/LPS O-acetylase OafA/YrhL